jgi:hypothetical protein
MVNQEDMISVDFEARGWSEERSLPSNLGLLALQTELGQIFG